MRLTETITGLAAFGARGPGTDAERRAANWLVDEIAAGGGDVRLEPFWSRPNWALAHAWHVALGLAGTLVSISAPAFGGAVVLVALLSIIGDAYFHSSPGRRLTLERASQNVVASAGEPHARVRLVITANYDAGRMGVVYRERPRTFAARLKRATGDRAPGWLAWIALALLALLGVAIARNGGSKGALIGVVQLIPTVVLVLALALLVEQATSDPSPAAGDNGSGVSVALALYRALVTAPPSRLNVELVLQGAGDASGIGLRRYLRGRRRELRPANTVVLGIAACGAGLPRWWTADGALVPMRFHERLTALCRTVAAEESHLQAAPHRGRGTTPAFPARVAAIPAITIGCLDEDGLAPRSHQPTDTADRVDQAALEGALTLALALVDAIDADLASRTARAEATAAA